MTKITFSLEDRPWMTDEKIERIRKAIFASAGNVEEIRNQDSSVNLLFRASPDKTKEIIDTLTSRELRIICKIEEVAD